MSNNLSAIKKAKVASRNCSQNKIYKSAIKKSVKRYLLNLHDPAEKSKNLSIVYQKIDKAVKKGILHKNTGARKKSRLTKMLNQHKK